MPTDLSVAPTPATAARLARSVSDATSTDELAAIVTDPDVTEDVLRQVTAKWHDLALTAKTIDWLLYLVLASPACTAVVIENAGTDYFHVSSVLRQAIERNLYVSPAAMKWVLGDDSWHSRDSDYRMTVLSHDCVTEEIVTKYAADWRVTVARRVAKHPLLTLEGAENLLLSTDAKTRANLACQPWMPLETLHLYRNDPDTAVARAAKKALKVRGVEERDEIDAVMDDEVSLFFLAASDDEATIRRLGSSLNAPEETLRMVAGLGGVGAMAVAGNRNAPSDLIESMSLDAAEAATYGAHDLMEALAGNPSNTGKGLEALTGAARWNIDIAMRALRNPNCTPLIAKEKVGYRSRQRTAAIQTGLLTRDELDPIIAHEHRDGVLRAFVNCKDATAADLRICYTRGGEKVRELAVARLVAMDEPLVVDA